MLNTTMDTDFNSFRELYEQDECAILVENYVTEGLTEENIFDAVDSIKLVLDIWGFEPFTGWIGDLASGGLSLGQAVWQKYFGSKPDEADGHAIDAMVSLISVVPMGDIAKIIKLRHGVRYAKLFVKAARKARKMASVHKRKNIVAGTKDHAIAGIFGDA